jgi:PAS domain S-box-containing protein
MIWVLGGVGGTLVFSLVWIRLLRKQVQQRTAELREEISERERAELTLRESESRFSAIFHASPVAIALSEKSDGRFVDVNATFLNMFGHSRSEVIGHTSAELNYLPSMQDRNRLVSELLEEGSQQIETKFRRKSGELFDVLLSAHPVQVGSQSYVLGTLLDITGRKHLEESLRQSQKMEGIGHLAGGIAHEFNNILGTMMMNLGLAGMSDGGGRNADLIDTLDGSCQKAADLVKQLLAFSRQSVIERRPVDFASVISGQVKMLRQFLGERIELELLAAPHLPWVKADKGLIEQVLLNLCINARDAMKNGGRVRLELAEEEVGAERAKTFAEARLGKFVRLSVTDTGCGMDDRTLKRLFEPFFTTKDIGKGTGLGLATVRGIVQQHQGWIEVESSVGNGSAFRVFLPATESVESGPAEVPEEKPASGNGTVLLVEDETPLRTMTHMLLTSHGYKVLDAENGSDALGVWSRHRSEIDLIFTDMVMPGNLSGLQLAKHALSEKPDLKVIITSGYHTDLVDLEKTSAASIAYLAKPCPPKILTATIDRCLGHN